MEDYMARCTCGTQTNKSTCPKCGRPVKKSGYRSGSGSFDNDDSNESTFGSDDYGSSSDDD